jgi:hypothetical protein
MARSSLSDQRRRGFLSQFLAAAKSRNAKGLKRVSSALRRSRIARSRFRFLACALTIVAATALVVGVIIFMTGRGSDDANSAHKVLQLTSQDIDPETTAVERNLLKKDQIDDRLAPALWSDARRQLSGPALKEAERALREGRVYPALEPLVKQLAADFANGKAAAFTIWVAEDESQKGNAVDLKLDGNLLGRFAIEQNRYAITVVERTGQSLRLEITGASGANRAAVFRAETATSEATTRHLGPGRNDTWQLMIR